MRDDSIVPTHLVMPGILASTWNMDQAGDSTNDARTDGCRTPTAGTREGVNEMRERTRRFI